MQTKEDDVVNNPVVRNTAMWVFGRLDELVKAGKLEAGQDRISELGRKKYRELVLTGFTPDPFVVASFVQMLFTDNRDAAFILLMADFNDSSKN